MLNIVFTSAKNIGSKIVKVFLTYYCKWTLHSNIKYNIISITCIENSKYLCNININKFITL